MDEWNPWCNGRGRSGRTTVDGDKNGDWETEAVSDVEYMYSYRSISCSVCLQSVRVGCTVQTNHVCSSGDAVPVCLSALRLLTDRNPAVCFVTFLNAFFSVHADLQGLLTIIPWTTYDNPVDYLRQSRGLLTIIPWTTYDNPVDYLWQSRGLFTIIPWTTYDNPVDYLR
jgi:hypothetical protein